MLAEFQQKPRFKNLSLIDKAVFSTFQEQAQKRFEIINLLQTTETMHDHVRSIKNNYLQNDPSNLKNHRSNSNA